MRKHIIALFSALVLGACAGGSAFYVNGVEPGELLKLREGPGFDYDIIVGLPNGTRLTRRDCQSRDGHLWCRVTVTDNPALSGYVSSNYMAGL